MYEIGYTTGTFDLPHHGHYEILKKCKFYCKYLIVGLVSDELGIRQKRKPVLDYEHRKVILENSKYIDAVVPFNGTTKQVDYKKINFNILFIADEYYLRDEYSSFERDFPNIPVVYFPRTETTSTSDIFKNIIMRVLSDLDTKAHGVAGDILQVEWKTGKNIILKPVKVSEDEIFNTKNNYNLACPPPRNWKLLNNNDNYPMISGVNPNREVEIFKILKDYDWYPVQEIIVKNTLNCSIDNNKIIDNIDLMNTKRKYTGKTYWLAQEDGGDTLDIYIKNKNAEERKSCYLWVKLLIEEMRKIGLLHMDLHPRNILFKMDIIFIIDFGWCMYKTFEYDDEERNYYQNSLDNNFDLIHFRESLVTCGIEKEIPDYLF